jgi:hypothetical protein
LLIRFRRFDLKRAAFVILAVILVLMCGTCSGKKDQPKECAQFEDYQIYPLDGTAGTLFELFVLLKDDSENDGVLGIVGDLLTSDGAETGKMFDLVQSDADQNRWLRSFTGDKLCDEGTCNLFFNVIATHKSGCVKGFSTAMFQVVIGADDTADDTSGDDGADDDSASADDDTAGDDTASDDTAG